MPSCTLFLVISVGFLNVFAGIPACLGFRGIGLAIIFRAVHRDLKRFSLPVRFFLGSSVAALVFAFAGLLASSESDFRVAAATRFGYGHARFGYGHARFGYGHARFGYGNSRFCYDGSVSKTALTLARTWGANHSPFTIAFCNITHVYRSTWCEALFGYGDFVISA